MSVAHSLALLLAVALLLPPQVTAVCDCWYGSQTSASPCACVCQADYLEPYCAFKAADSAVILTALTTPRASFVSAVMESSLQSNLNAGTTGVLFRILDENPANPFRAEYPGQMIVQWTMTGSVASRFLLAVVANESWVAANNISGANVNNMIASPTSDFGGSLVFYSDGSKVTITVNTVGWIIGVLILFCCSCIECCCVTNSTKYAQLKADEERLEKQKRLQDSAPQVVEGIAILVSEGKQPNPLNSQSPPGSPRPRSVATEEHGDAFGASATQPPPVVCDPNYVADPPSASAEGNQAV